MMMMITWSPDTANMTPDTQYGYFQTIDSIGYLHPDDDGDEDVKESIQLRPCPL